MKGLEDFQNEYMIKVKGGIYKPSFEEMEKIVFDIEVSKYLKILVPKPCFCLSFFIIKSPIRIVSFSG